jgi:Zn-dependent M16 (insulinase) family peptidase
VAFCFHGAQLSDLPRAPKRIPFTASTLSVSASSPSTPWLVHEQPTNGIGYVRLSFDVSALPQRYLSLLPLYCRCVSQLGTVTSTEVSERRWSTSVLCSRHSSAAACWFNYASCSIDVPSTLRFCVRLCGAFVA